MDLNILRSLVTLISFGVFIGIVVYAWRARNAVPFAEAAALPFAGESAPGTGGDAP
jgi:cytochrome c oxidase cbb3-type subunit IV